MTLPTPERREILSSSSDDLLYGVAVIADHIETPETLTLLALGTGVLPGIKVGGILIIIGMFIALSLLWAIFL